MLLPVFTRLLDRRKESQKLGGPRLAISRPRPPVTKWKEMAFPGHGEDEPLTAVIGSEYR